MGSIINLYTETQAYMGNKYLFALLILIVFYALSELFLFAIKKIILQITKRTRTLLDDRLIKSVTGPVSFILLMLGIKIADHILDVELISKIASPLTDSLIIITAAYAAAKAAAVIIDHSGHAWAKKTESTIDDMLIPIIKKVSGAAIGIICLLILFKRWGIDITGILAGIGIAGIAVGFAVKDSLANIFGGISMVLDRVVRIGDTIRLSTGETGIVEDVGLRTTKIRTPDNELLIMPNGIISNQMIRNDAVPDKKTRITVPFSVEYGQDINNVKKLVLKEISGIDDALKNPKPSVYFDSMGESSLNFKAFLWVDSLDKKMKAKEDANYLIYNALNRAKIGIPFPTRTVYMRK